MRPIGRHTIAGHALRTPVKPGKFPGSEHDVTMTTRRFILLRVVALEKDRDAKPNAG